MPRATLRLFPRPGDVHPDAAPPADPRSVEDKNRTDARFSSGTGSVLMAAPEPVRPGAGGKKQESDKKREKRKQDEQADEASQESFPASDPPAKY
jgi:hypothetical protein